MRAARKASRAGWILSTALAVLALGCGRGGRTPRPSGTLEGTEVRLSAALAARVLEVRVAEGQSVRAGDTLLVLDLSLQRLQRAQSAAGLAVLAARRQRAQDQAREAAATLLLAEQSLARVKALHQAGSATDQQLDEARAQREQAAAREQGVAHEGRALEAECAALEAALAVQDRLLRDAALLAPSAGTVLQRVAEPGEWTAPGQPALVLADLARLELRFYLSERDLAQVRIGQSLQLRVDAFPGQSFPGLVSWVAAQAEFTPRNAQTTEARAQLVYAVRAQVDNPQGRLLIGMPAEVVLEQAAK